MSAINLTIRRDIPILCPGCQAELAGPVIYIIGNVVFCRRCAATLPDLLIKRILRRTKTEMFSGLFSESGGLLYLCPPRTAGKDRLRLLTLMLPEDPDHEPFHLYSTRLILTSDEAIEFVRPLPEPGSVPATNPPFGRPGPTIGGGRSTKNSTPKDRAARPGSDSPQPGVPLSGLP